ncbi:MAG: nucleotide exchange factor GrpE [Clostridia bacterium]|nr:nucleotide exchange factor GrpE [Clostridia bacterium]
MIKDPNAANEEIKEEVTEEVKKETKKKTTKKKESKSGKEVAELKELLDGKINELAEMNDKYLRVLAEYDNYKKRTQKEKEAIYVDSVGETVTALLPIIDNFERAVSTFSEEDKQTDFFKGIEMIYNQMLDTFSKLGVEPIKALGEEFNPELHNAVMHIEDESIADNTVVEEFQKGYIYREKVIRYSMVKVAN